MKVFGLGLSKTGTSSLTEALNLLGIKSVHYPADGRTLAQLQAGDYRLSLMDEYAGATDIPVAPFYAQLDEAFPGSKFILTVRDKDSWLRSCEVHWRLMAEWRDNYPEFRRAHEFYSACTYGTLEYNRARFSFAYDAHVANVRRYFAGREADLLEIDVCGGEGWENLCPFLDLPMLYTPFPHANEWMHLLAAADDDVARTIGEGKTLILVDEQGFGSSFAKGRRRIPFLERDGEYWGAPIDDATAIRELERLRAEGAGYIVFGFPSFWWLEYYAELERHLRTSYLTLLANERVRIFDLRL